MTIYDNFDPIQFLKIAKDIDNAISNSADIKLNESNSAWMRSAISRTYYSVFLTLRKQLLANSKFKDRIGDMSKDHEEILSILLTYLPIDMTIYANDLQNLRENRNHADYDAPPKFQVNKNIVKKCLAQADRIINNMSKIMASL